MADLGRALETPARRLQDDAAFVDVDGVLLPVRPDHRSRLLDQDPVDQRIDRRGQPGQDVPPTTAPRTFGASASGMIEASPAAARQVQAPRTLARAMKSSSPWPRASAIFNCSRTASNAGNSAQPAAAEARRRSLCRCLTEN